MCCVDAVSWTTGLVFQPSELAKLALVVFMAVFLARRLNEARSFWRTLLPGLTVVGLVAGLVGIEDFGTAGLLALVGGAMLLAAGCRVAHMAAMAVPAFAAAAFLVISEPYRFTRLTTFFDIWADPRGAGYHPVQSLATIASGGWFGRGLGAGVQKYGYLPAIQTDFIFAGLCEETGVLGGMVVILLFLTLLVMGLRITRHGPPGAPSLLAFGVTTLITLQAVINIAVVTVMAPTKGIALPFVSAGGSGIVFLAALAGLLAAVAYASRTEPADLALSHPIPPIHGRLAAASVSG
jgi:cell division protein FtsW